jgi:hypothetical protein
VLPWLRCCGYDILTLGEAAAASTAGLPELTFDTLAAHTLGVQGGIAPAAQRQPANGGSVRYSSYGDLHAGLDGEEDVSVRSVSEQGASVGRAMGRQATAGSFRQLEGVTESADKLRMSAAYMVHMAKVSRCVMAHMAEDCATDIALSCGCGVVAAVLAQQHVTQPLYSCNSCPPACSHLQFCVNSSVTFKHM